MSTFSPSPPNDQPVRNVCFVLFALERQQEAVDRWVQHRWRHWDAPAEPSLQQAELELGRALAVM